MPVQPRDISPLLQAMRDFLLGRKHTKALRFQQFIASRSPSPPCLPDGPTHKLSANYYCSRDARREVMPPVLVATDKTQIGTGEPAVELKELPKPGRVHHWD